MEDKLFSFILFNKPVRARHGQEGQAGAGGPGREKQDHEWRETIYFPLSEQHLTIVSLHSKLNINLKSIFLVYFENIF